MLYEDGCRAAFGGLLLDVGEVGFEEGLARSRACLTGDDFCRVFAFGADIVKDACVGISQEPRVLVGFATDHDAIQVLELFFDLVKRLDAAVDAQVQVRHFGLEAVDELVVEWRYFAVFLGRESLEPSLAGVDNENLATGVAHGLDKVRKELPAVEVVDANAALDRNWNRDGILHCLEAIGDNLLFLHEACAELPVLHAVRRAAAVQVDFCKARLFDKLGCLR